MSFKMIDYVLNEGRKYEYGCAMLYFVFPMMNKIHDAIDPDDVYEEEDDDSFGFETEPHVTLLFGLHKEVTDEDVKGVINNFTFAPIKLTKLSTFKNEKYDVLKFDISDDGGGHALYEVNKELKKFPFTSDFPDYHPHMTVGYLKSGTGDKWVKKLKVQEFTLTPKYAIYSKPNKGKKEKTKFKIEIT